LTSTSPLHARLAVADRRAYARWATSAIAELGPTRLALSHENAVRDEALTLTEALARRIRERL
jgi:hypothetical protein